MCVLMDHRLKGCRKGAQETERGRERGFILWTNWLDALKLYFHSRTQKERANIYSNGHPWPTQFWQMHFVRGQIKLGKINNWNSKFKGLRDADVGEFFLSLLNPKVISQLEANRCSLLYSLANSAPSKEQRRHFLICQWATTWEAECSSFWNETDAVYLERHLKMNIVKEMLKSKRMIFKMERARTWSV